MKKFFLMIIISFVNNTVLAQLAPWRAKIMLHNQYGYSDTLWIGCDTAGDIDYQQGLDIIDTTFRLPLGVLGHDTAINFGKCYNLKKDIKNFVNGIQYFDFQVLDTLPEQRPYDYIKIDTNEFRYSSGKYKITTVAIQTDNGYITGIDGTRDNFYYNGDTTDFNATPPFYTDSVSLIFEPSSFNCISTNYNQIHLGLFVGFTDFAADVKVIEQPSPKIFPNPSNGIFYVMNVINAEKFKVLDLACHSIRTGKLERGTINGTINLSDLPKGFYLLRLEEGNSVNRFFKILIQ